MSLDLIRRVESLGRPHVLVVGDLILDRDHWGEVEPASPDDPVPRLRAERSVERLGGAAGVAAMLSALGAEVSLLGVVGRDPAGGRVRQLLADHAIDDRLVLDVEGRQTPLKERFLVRGDDRPPRPLLQVEHAMREPISQAIESALLARAVEGVAEATVVLVADHDRGACTPVLLKRLIAACRSLAVRVVAAPARAECLPNYRWAHGTIVNRREAERATGIAIARPDDAFQAGRRLVESFDLEAILVTLDGEGIALVRGDRRAEFLPARPCLAADAAGAGHMKLAAVGLALAAGADYGEGATLASVASGLRVETPGEALLTRDALLAELTQRAGELFEAAVGRVTIGEPASPSGGPLHGEELPSARLDPPEVHSPAAVHRGSPTARGASSAWFPG